MQAIHIYNFAYKTPCIGKRFLSGVLRMIEMCVTRPSSASIVRGNSMNATVYVEMFNIESGFGAYDKLPVFDHDAFVGYGSRVVTK